MHDMIHSVLKHILLRKGIRSDKMWGSWLLFREPFRRIPFYMDVYALSKSQYWPREELKKLRLERFKETVKHAATIPFWRKRFEQAGVDPYLFTESDIARIPILTKKDFLESSIEEYTVPALLPQSREYHTSGSTGKPLTFYHDRAYELRSSGVSERMFRAAGQGVRFPLIHARMSRHVGFDFAKHYYFFLPGYAGVRHRVRELTRLISEFPNGVVLYGVGSTILEIARAWHEHSDLFPFKCILYTGEELRDVQRKEIEESLHTQLRLTYGMSEMRRLGFECEKNRIHLNEDGMYHFEIINNKGVSLPSENEGRIIATGFDHRVMPFIRYDTGDVGVIHDEPCPCGRTLRTLEFKGRQTKLLDVGDGRIVSLLNIPQLFDIYYSLIQQFQIIRNDTRAFTIKIVPRAALKEETILPEIEERFKLLVHPAAEIEWEVVDAIVEGPNGKALYFIDRHTGKSSQLL